MASERFFNGLYYNNLGIAYSAGTFTVQGANGRALSSSNPAVIVLPDKDTPGQFKRYNITANQSFIDDAGSSEIINNLFGATTGIAWAQDIVFYLYTVGNDAQNAIAFMIGRYPHLKQSPAAASIGAPDDAVADTEASLWSFDNIDETLYESNPCLCIGSFRMRMSASDDWTVQALDNGDGIGRFNEERDLTFPTNQNGAESGTHMLDNGGTAPTFSSALYKYRVYKNGTVFCNYNMSGNTATDGSGAVTAQLALPMSCNANQSVFSGFGVSLSSVGTGAIVAQILPISSNTYANLSTGTSAIQNGNFSDGNRFIQGNIYYQLP